MSAVLIRPRPSNPRTNSDLLTLLVATMILAAVMAAVVPALRLPPDVDRITIANPHSWNVDVEVTDSERDGWLGLGALGRESEQTFEEVIDQGDRWIFRFSYAGQEVERDVSRAQLERDGWKVTIPPQFADRLRHAGVQQSAH